jgi:HAD superfamily hydrolase (TIGR01549 family)
MLRKYTTISWDFDGVILNSNIIRTRGVIEIFKKFPEEKVFELVKYHLKNGGLSRYHKIEYFFTKILRNKMTQDKIFFYAEKYKVYILNNLVDKRFIIKDTLDYIKEIENTFSMHIVSASDENELKQICKKLELDSFFISIHGSPVTKKENIKRLLKHNKLINEEVVLIGDSINDYEAALDNKIDFVGYNNIKLKNKQIQYITSFKTLTK